MKKLLLFMFIVPIACKQVFTPPVKAANKSLLVVEGFINNGVDTTTFRLSRTLNVQDPRLLSPELHAKLAVQGSDHSSYPLVESGNGIYFAPGLALNHALQYRLDIRTAAGEEYQSDFVTLKSSPPIDSINWVSTGDGIQIYANTHDPQDSSLYYRWEYVETWEFHSVYFSIWKYERDSLLYRDQDTFYTCWKGDSSTNVLLGTSAALASDVINQAPMLVIPTNSWHLGVQYSVQVTQYVLTPDAYGFWLNLQKNTEQIGSLFSPQPSEIKGNIHSLSDTSEQVVGYISGGTYTQKRIFISKSQVPDWVPDLYEKGCMQSGTSQGNPMNSFYFGRAGYLPTTTLPPGSIPPIVLYSDSSCVDCTLTGSNHKPYFWP